MNDFITKITTGLNDEQLQAVTHVDGPLLVIAGAGSGKTKVLTHRIAYLIGQGIQAESILAVTFTNKASNEMKERIESLLKGFGDGSSPTLGTFHAVCMRILRANIHLIGYENSCTIYDTADQEALMKTIIKDLNLSDKTYAPRAILSKISNAKNFLINPIDFAAKASDEFNMTVGECYKQYQKRLKMSGALDFDDIIMKTIELFQAFPEVLARYNEKYKYVMIDEYQDTNYAQFVLTEMFVKKYKNLMVVGDSDQSIYGFRGANASNILDFEKQFPGAKKVVLSTNYRSTEKILSVANSVIEKNKSRHKKEMKPVIMGGQSVKVLCMGNGRDEALGVAERLENSRPHSYSDFAVLYRTNAQSRVFEEAFIRYGIPYKIVGGVKFYSRKEIKDILAYLKIIQNPNDSVSLLRIINTPARAIGPKTIETLRDVSSGLGMSIFDAMSGCDAIAELSSSKREAIKAFVKLIEHLRSKAKEYNVSGLLKYLIVETGYKEFLLNNKSDDKDDLGDGQVRYENVQELISVASKYNELEPAISLSTFLEEVSLIADIDSLDSTDNAVVLMTIHSAKGLEFDSVFVVGMEDGLFPHFNSMTSQQDLEEERRLLYVAITRAKQSLTISFARSRMLFGETKECVPSQFLKEIPKELLEGDLHALESAFDRLDRNLGYRQSYQSYRNANPASQIRVNTAPQNVKQDMDVHLSLKSGDKIIHKSWGEGIVREVIGGVVSIEFKDMRIGSKKLAINIAPITKVS